MVACFHTHHRLSRTHFRDGKSCIGLTHGAAPLPHLAKGPYSLLGFYAVYMQEVHIYTYPPLLFMSRPMFDFHRLPPCILYSSKLLDIKLPYLSWLCLSYSS